MSIVIKYWKSSIWIVCVLFLSFLPASSLSSDWDFFENQDKLIHLIMYGGISFLLLLDMHFRMFNNYRFIIVMLLSIVLFSTIIEILQPIFSNRGRDLFDVIANFIGAVLGVSFFQLLFRKKRVKS